MSAARGFVAAVKALDRVEIDIAAAVGDSIRKSTVRQDFAFGKNMVTDQAAGFRFAGILEIHSMASSAPRRRFNMVPDSVQYFQEFL